MAARRQGVVGVPQTAVVVRKSHTSRAGGTGTDGKIAKKVSADSDVSGPKRSRDRRTHSRESETDVPPFEYLLTQGKTYQNKANYKAAIAAYSKALEQKPDHTATLLARSNCCLQIGDTKAALLDANTLLTDDKNNIRGLQQKADVLYQMAEFEQALVLYHRGNKLRSDIQSFRLGIQLCHEAIENCIGDKAGIKLDKSGDLSFFTQLQHTKEPSSEKRPQQRTFGDREPSRLEPVKADRKKRQCTEAEEKKMKELLEQLYTDKQYLEKLLDETEKVNATSKTSDDIIELSTECLDYLDTRATFWQQKEPTYSKERNRKLQESTRDKTETLVKRGDNKGDATSWIMKNLQQIDDDQMVGKYEESLRRAEKVLKRTEQFNDQELPRRFELEAHLHSYIGNAHLELGHLNEALKHHQKDYNIAKQHNLPEASARAIDNIGRVFIRQHKYKQAIQLFDERLPTVSHPLEKTWLFHEIGRCYLELGNASKALEFGEQSMEAATDACDHTWQLNASVLLAQANVKLRQYEEAVDCFERALDLAKCADDPEAISAIESAIRDVHRLIHDNTRDEHSDSPDSKTHMKSGHDITDADANSSSPRDESSPGRHSPRDKGSPGKHSPPEKSSPDRHSPRDKGSPDRHSPQLKSSPGKHSPPKKNSPDKHSPRDKGSPGRHSPQDNSSPGRHSPLDNSSPGRHSPRDKGSPDRHSPGDKGSPDRHSPQDKGSPDRHSPQDKGSPDRHSLQDNSSPGRHSPRDKDLPGEHSPQDNSSPGRHTPQDDSSPGKHSLEEKSSPDRHSPGDKGSPVDIKEYKVTIKISDVDNAAGSDFNGLYVQLTGDRGTTGQLDLELGNRKLERTTENEFTVKAIDVGQINQVLLGHRSSSSGLGPHVAQVHVHSESTEDSYTFHCHQWLDSSKEIQLCRVPTNLRVTQVPYTVTVRTEDELGAGTDSKVFLEIYGEFGQTDRHILHTSETHSNKFEKGQTDIFKLEAANVGQVRTIRIGHDNSKFGAAWMLNDVTVECQGKLYHFKANRWLAESKGDKRTQIELVAE